MTPTSGHRREDGQVAVMFALVLALVLAGLIALVGDVVVLYDAAGRYDNGVLVGAQAGASQVDEGLLRQGQVVLESGRAVQVCQDAAAVTSGLAPSDVTCTISPDGRSITARTSRRVALVFDSLGPAYSISVSHTGTVAIGESAGAAP